MTRDEACGLARRLRASYPQSRVTDESEGVYAAQLVGYPRDAATRAVEKLVSQSEHFPSMKRLIQAITDEMPAVLSGTSYAQALSRQPNQKCDLCRGSGWVDDEPVIRGDRRYTMVQPCRCRYSSGGPGAPEPVNRDAFPEPICEALTKIEFATKKPLAQSALRLAWATWKAVGVQETVRCLTNALKFVHMTPRQMFAVLGGSEDGPKPYSEAHQDLGYKPHNQRS